MSDLEDLSQIQRNFKEAFEATELPQVATSDRRIAQLEELLKTVREKLKKEETSRKSYQEIARRKDEEIKRA